MSWASKQGSSTIAPTTMAYSSARAPAISWLRLGAIRYIDTAGSNAGEVQFANTALAVHGLAASATSCWRRTTAEPGTHYVINSAGVITDSAEWNYYSRDYAWDPVTSRVYFLRDDTSPNDPALRSDRQGTGQITSAVRRPITEITASVSDTRVRGRPAHVCSEPATSTPGNGCDLGSAVGSQLADARWFADGFAGDAHEHPQSDDAAATRSHQSSRRLEQPAVHTAGLRVVGDPTTAMWLVCA
jgi:hypothetical protein